MGNRLVLLRFTRKKSRHQYAIFKCECGKEKELRVTAVVSSGTKSCGCWRVESIRTKSITHGQTHTSLHRRWNSMIGRCELPKTTGYNNYGARGIKVCQEWRSSFVVFRDWALANGYEEHLQLDRIDNNGNYEPSNCRFVTAQVNNRNRR